MKQNITLEQYQELNDDNRIKWAKVVLKHLEEHQENFELTLKDIDYVDVHQSTTIGQMIEFLWDHQARSSSNYSYIDELFRNVIKTPYDESSLGIGWENKELCDDLWKFCKEVLNKA